jgi:hypothetical protein
VFPQVTRLAIPAEKCHFQRPRSAIASLHQYRAAVFPEQTARSRDHGRNQRWSSAANSRIASARSALCGIEVVGRVGLPGGNNDLGRRVTYVLAKEVGELIGLWHNAKGSEATWRYGETRYCFRLHVC